MVLPPPMLTGIVSPRHSPPPAPVLFFFQAEDGIRDGRVTGVQTCALPICHQPRGRRPDGQGVLHAGGAGADRRGPRPAPAAPAGGSGRLAADGPRHRPVRDPGRAHRQRRPRDPGLVLRPHPAAVPDGPAPRRWRLTEPAGTPGRRTYADSMRLDEDQRALLSKARIGMLAISGRLPLVNPAAFHFGGDALWMTTSRHAAKLALIRRDPRAAFLVTPERRQRGHGVLLQGMLEAYDPRSVRSQVRAALQGPGFALSLAGYALKNVAFIGGYLM